MKRRKYRGKCNEKSKMREKIKKRAERNGT
jgi:hypothetical protein